MYLYIFFLFQSQQTHKKQLKRLTKKFCHVIKRDKNIQLSSMTSQSKMADKEEEEGAENVLTWQPSEERQKRFNELIVTDITINCNTITITETPCHFVSSL